jgi:hypothetical protein
LVYHQCYADKALTPLALHGVLQLLSWCLTTFGLAYKSVHTKRYEYKQTAEMYQHGTIKNVAKIYTDGHGYPFGIIITRVVQGAA